jgi:hypothetical protein
MPTRHVTIQGVMTWEEPSGGGGGEHPSQPIFWPPYPSHPIWPMPPQGPVSPGWPNLPGNWPSLPGPPPTGEGGQPGVPTHPIYNPGGGYPSQPIVLPPTGGGGGGWPEGGEPPETPGFTPVGEPGPIAGYQWYYSPTLGWLLGVPPSTPPVQPPTEPPTNGEDGEETEPLTPEVFFS